MSERPSRKTEAATSDPYGWRRERKDLMAAIAGGAIVGMPLLYTMEMWQHGILLSEWHLLAMLGAMLVVNFAIDLFAGFRDDYTLTGAAAESITSVGIGVVLATVILGIIGELKTDIAPLRIVGKVMLEAAIVSVGVSFANLQVRGKSRVGAEDEANAVNGNHGAPNSRNESNHLSLEQKQVRADLRDVGASVAGAVVFALNIAPTEEVMLISVQASPWRQLLMLVAGVVLCYIILFASGFEDHQVHVKSVFQHPWAETAMNCAIALLVAAGLLLLLGQREIVQHHATFIAATVTLGLPAMVGGAAGRIIL
jgi:putative integral membrane protein (TIGR02587 family)